MPSSRLFPAKSNQYTAYATPLPSKVSPARAFSMPLCSRRTATSSSKSTPTPRSITNLNLSNLLRASRQAKPSHSVTPSHSISSPNAIRSAKTALQSAASTSPIRPSCGAAPPKNCRPSTSWTSTPPICSKPKFSRSSSPFNRLYPSTAIPSMSTARAFDPPFRRG